MEIRRLIKYVLITFLTSWICWWGLAVLIKTTSLVHSDIHYTIIFLIGGFGPTIATLFCLEEKLSFKALTRFLFTYKVKSIYYFLLLLALEIATFGISSLEFNPAIDLNLTPLIILQAIFIYGGNEELGWRGIMQPILQKKMPYPLATLITGTVWALWHIPLWFIEGDGHQRISFFMFAILAILLSYWLSAVYNKTKCVFFCSVMHGITNSLLSIVVLKINLVLVIGIIILTSLSIWFCLQGNKQINSGVLNDNY